MVEDREHDREPYEPRQAAEGQRHRDDAGRDCNRLGATGRADLR